jgi:hypothetical protein
VLLAACALGCGQRGDGGAQGAPDGGGAVTLAPQGKVLEAAENEAPRTMGSQAAPHPGAGGGSRAAAPEAGPPQIDVPAGKLVAGSTPGDKGREPSLEPSLLEVELGGFTIDRFLYPSDPARPPLTGVTRSRATELCQQAGGRLCTELEWERACKGPEETPYAGGAAWDPECAKVPASCASGFGALGMGALREWTASDVTPAAGIANADPRAASGPGASNEPRPGSSGDPGPPEGEAPLLRAAAVRGAPANAGGVDHRCARRTAVDPTSSGTDLGFRCCRGAPNAATIPSPQWQQTFRRAEITPAQVAEMLSSVPQLKGLGGEIGYFKEPDDVGVVLSRGDAGAPPPNTTLTTAPLLWNPVPGEEVLVVAGRADKDSFIVAFYRLPGDRYRIASALLLKNERGPVSLGFNGYVRRRLAWATCWDCRGESGNVTYREDNRVVITQK